MCGLEAANSFFVLRRAADHEAVKTAFHRCSLSFEDFRISRHSPFKCQSKRQTG